MFHWNRDNIRFRAVAANGVGYFDIEIPSGQVAALPEKLEAGIALKVVAIDTLTNKPTAGIKFYIVKRSPGAITSMAGSERTTADDGVAQWDKLTPGPAEVGVRSDAYGRWWTDEMKQQQWMRGIDDVPLELSRDMPPVTIHVEPAVQVSGQVLSPSGEPVSSASVDIAGMLTGDARYARRTDAKGNFKLTFPILATDGRDGGGIKYAIVASDTQHRWANATGDWFSPTVGQKLSLTLKMTPGARLRGRIVRSDGQPVAHLEVQGQADDQLDRMYYNPRTLTDEGGHFELGSMRAGQYSIYLNPEQGRVTSRSDPTPATTRVAGGDRVDVGDIKYDGPAPSPVPAWYSQTYGVPASTNPSTQADGATWRHVAIPAPPPTPIQDVAAPCKRLGTMNCWEIPRRRGCYRARSSMTKGSPITGVSIRIWTWQPDHGNATDDKGQFSLRKLGADRKVEIRFSKEGYCPKYIPQQPTGLSDLVVVLTNKTYFEGQVKGPDGNPVAGAKIRADQGPKQGDGVTITNVWTDTVADGQGKYRLYVQPDGYDIHVSMPGVGVVRTGKTLIRDGEAKHLDPGADAGNYLSREDRGFRYGRAH